MQNKQYNLTTLVVARLHSHDVSLQLPEGSGFQDGLTYEASAALKKKIAKAAKCQSRPREAGPVPAPTPRLSAAGRKLLLGHLLLVSAERGSGSGRMGHDAGGDGMTRWRWDAHSPQHVCFSGAVMEPVGSSAVLRPAPDGVCRGETRCPAGCLLQPTL